MMRRASDEIALLIIKVAAHLKASALSFGNYVFGKKNMKFNPFDRLYFPASVTYTV